MATMNDVQEIRERFVRFGNEVEEAIAESAKSVNNLVFDKLKVGSENDKSAYRGNGICIMTNNQSPSSAEMGQKFANSIDNTVESWTERNNALKKRDISAIADISVEPKYSRPK